MPRGKKSIRRGNFQAASRGGRNGRAQHPLETDFMPFDGTGSPRGGHRTPRFTLQDEARNTDRKNLSWDADQRLRHTKVNFVSAGSYNPTDPEETEHALEEMTIGSPNQGDEESADENTMVAAPDQVEGVSPLDQSLDEITTPSFTVDILGSGPVETGIPLPQVRSGSPTPSDSSEEVILFGGRDERGRGISRARPKQPRKATDPIDQKIRIIDDQIQEQKGLLDEVIHSHTVPPPPGASELFSQAPASSRAPANHKSKKNQRKNNRPGNARNSIDDAVIADYIANMQDDLDDSNEGNGDGTFPKLFSQRDLGAAEDAIWQDTEASSGEPSGKTQQLRDSNGWDDSNICDFDDMSTSDGVMGEVQTILSKRERVGGIQYLVVWENQDVDEARWVPVTTLTSITALAHIATFEAEELLVAEFVEGDSDSESDSDEIEVEIDDDQDDGDDEEDMIKRKIDRMSDEKIARLLAKQEELGLGSDELLLFDDDSDTNEEKEVELDQGYRNSFVPFSPSIKRGQSQVSRRLQGGFPSAMRLTDAYDGFDVMDFERPSLKKKPKGRKGKISFENSDSELEYSMNQTWENDRMKKKDRKQQREELRAQGLLGSKNGKPDLKQKYKEGMGIHAVKEEIKRFLMGRDTTLSLPPMDKADRKVVHELANAFKLKSKSAGNGNKRYPVLYKTTRTSHFVESTFNDIEARVTRRFLPRMDVGGSKSRGGFKRGGGFGGGGGAAASYRDGDVVGASAPELGIDNKGRAMLEKMGWSTGTALGALNNKGILQPVTHVVKTTKAGLG